MTTSATDTASDDGTRQRLGLVLGPLLFAALLVLPRPDGVSEAAWRTAAVAALMATWWVTEAIPIPATALLPLVLLPLLGIAPIAAAAAPYANEVIFLFLGGFVIAAALEACGLHRRMALVIIAAVGTRPVRLVFGFMAATAFLSMWVSNTATVVMMLPIAASVIALVDERCGSEAARPFAVSLLLGLAYAATIGGLGTLIGTPPNALLAAFVRQTYGIEIGFAQWMLLGVPFVVVGLPLCWLLLVKVLQPVRIDALPGGRTVLDEQRRALGPLSRAERQVGAITLLVALSWVARPQLERWITGLSDAGIAIGGALLLFALPVRWRPLRTVIDWVRIERLPWGVLILFGGGLSLAQAIAQSGLAAEIGGGLGVLASWPRLALLLAVTAVIVFLTELTSNTATAAAFFPVAGGVASGIGQEPLVLLLPVALAASCAFMMPVATPPNALVYASGRVTIGQMARAGLWLNLLFIGLIVAAVELGAGSLVAGR